VPVVALIAAAVACARLPDEATIDIGGTTLAIGPIARANALFACGAGAVVALLGTVQHRSVGHGIFASVVASSLVIGAFAGDMARVGGAGVHVAMMVAAMAMALGDSGGVGAGQSGWRAATAYLTLGSLGLVIIVAGLSLADVLRVNPGGLVTESFVIAVLAAGFALAIGLPPVHFWVPVVSWRPDIGSSTLVLGVVVPATVGYLVQVLAGLPQLGGAALTARLLTVAGLLACIVGALGATSPGRLGRRVGYASIAGIGPTLLGLGMATRIGAAGALVALAHHAACMIVLVATTGAVERDAGSTPIRGSLAGAVSDGQTPVDQHATASGRNNRVERWRSGRRLHRIAFILATLAASGIPPLSGFASRWAIMQALSLADWRLAMVVGITSLVTLAALLTSVARRSPSQVATPYHLPEAGGASNEAMRGDGGGLLVVYSLVTCVWGFVPAWVIEQTWRATAQLGYLRPF
jgi:formate hydrogenlyase subunit 3/multisubunit Na+/H+ antiporter MnhD subunit